MTKRLVEIDDTLLDEARAATREETITGTVTAALRLAVEQMQRKEEELRQRWAEVAPLMKDLHNPEIMDGAWR